MFNNESTKANTEKSLVEEVAAIIHGMYTPDGMTPEEELLIAQRIINHIVSRGGEIK